MYGGATEVKHNFDHLDTWREDDMWHILEAHCEIMRGREIG